MAAVADWFVDREVRKAAGREETGAIWSKKGELQRRQYRPQFENEEELERRRRAGMQQATQRQRTASILTGELDNESVVSHKTLLGSRSSV